MDIYRHYKSHLYRYHGLVKHSETLEEFVSYQCLYDNPEGLNWVRPKSMFFENVTVDSKSVPRFERIDLSLEIFSNLESDRKKQLIELGQKLFPGYDGTQIYNEWNKLSDYQLIIASIEDRAIAFQLSYPLTRDVYFIWFQGVLPEFQDLGVASRLLAESEVWCSQNLYRKLIVKAFSTNTKHLILLLNHQFIISGVEDSGLGNLVICEKNIPKS